MFFLCCYVCQVGSLNINRNVLFTDLAFNLDFEMVFEWLSTPKAIHRHVHKLFNKKTSLRGQVEDGKLRFDGVGSISIGSTIGPFSKPHNTQRTRGLRTSTLRKSLFHTTLEKGDLDRELSGTLLGQFG